MRQAYLEGKDLYCVIASQIYNNKYEENLENFVEGTVVELDGKKIVAGNDKTYEKQVTDKLEIPYYYLVPTPTGMKVASEIKIGDKIVAKEGNYEAVNVITENDITVIYFKD